MKINRFLFAMTAFSSLSLNAKTIHIARLSGNQDHKGDQYQISIMNGAKSDSKASKEINFFTADLLKAKEVLENCPIPQLEKALYVWASATAMTLVFGNFIHESLDKFFKMIEPKLNSNITVNLEKTTAKARSKNGLQMGKGAGAKGNIFGVTDLPPDPITDYLINGRTPRVQALEPVEMPKSLKLAAATILIVVVSAGLFVEYRSYLFEKRLLLNQTKAYDIALAIYDLDSDQSIQIDVEPQALAIFLKALLANRNPEYRRNFWKLHGFDPAIQPSFY